MPDSRELVPARKDAALSFDENEIPMAPKLAPASTEQTLRLTRVAFAWVFIAVTILIVLMIISAVATMIFIANNQNIQPLDKSMIARLMQITFGMIIGSGCLFLGVIISWFGINSSFAIDAGGSSAVGKGKLALSSSSPGIVLIIGGVVLLAASLYRPINYFEGPATLFQPVTPQDGH